jgi:hypothetical protein
MLSFMKRFEHHTYALMRVMAGFLLIWHGTGTYFGFPRVSPAEGISSFRRNQSPAENASALSGPL